MRYIKNVAGPANYSTVPHLDGSMILKGRPAPYNSIPQIIIRHLHWMMIVQYSYCIVLSSVGAGAISKLKLHGYQLQDKVVTSNQVQCNYYQDAETSLFYFPCGGVLFILKNKAKWF
jgi:hypothetical protein